MGDMKFKRNSEEWKWQRERVVEDYPFYPTKMLAEFYGMKEDTIDKMATRMNLHKNRELYSNDKYPQELMGELSIMAHMQQTAERHGLQRQQVYDGALDGMYRHNIKSKRQMLQAYVYESQRRIRAIKAI